MPYLITHNCIRCKYTDCVAVCPVDCFRAGESMLVIDPTLCIDCGVCVPECPAEAIRSDAEPGMAGWSAFNAKYAGIWPVIALKAQAPEDAADWNGRPDKLLAAFGTNDPALA